MNKKISGGIIIIGISGIILGFLKILGGIALTIFTSSWPTSSTSPAAIISAITAIIVGISILFSGIFILKLKNWARILFIINLILCGINEIYFILVIHHRAADSSINSIVYFLLPFGWPLIIPFLPHKAVFIILPIIIIYLVLPKVKHQFKREKNII
ncbi:MAG: hypothetical protein V1891_04695 [bacterium]